MGGGAWRLGAVSAVCVAAAAAGPPGPVHDQIVIGTPGTVSDLVFKRRLDLSQLRVFAIDEADEMLAQQVSSRGPLSHPRPSWCPAPADALVLRRYPREGGAWARAWATKRPRFASASHALAGIRARGPPARELRRRRGVGHGGGGGEGLRAARTCRQVPRGCQILLFSATYPQAVSEYARKFVPDANSITLKVTVRARMQTMWLAC